MINDLVRGMMKKLSSHFRKKRIQLLNQKITLSSSSIILDLGGGDGSHFSSYLNNSFIIADLRQNALQRGKDKGLHPVQISQDCGLPFADNSIDFLFCNSVIEHATGPKQQVKSTSNSSKFQTMAKNHQRKLANEIRRIARSYWVQTPNRNFPLETHSWFPMVQFLNRPLQLRTLNLLNRFWFKQTSGDYYLFSKNRLQDYFPKAEILKEKTMGLCKSMIAFKSPPNLGGSQ